MPEKVLSSRHQNYRVYAGEKTESLEEGLFDTYPKTEAYWADTLKHQIPKPGRIIAGVRNGSRPLGVPLKQVSVPSRRSSTILNYIFGLIAITMGVLVIPYSLRGVLHFLFVFPAIAWVLVGFLHISWVSRRLHKP